MKKKLFVTAVAILCIAGRVNADIGWADSAVFQLNLLTVPTSTCGFADSSPFNLNLYPVNRAWADSDSFSFDWLANTACQVGPYRLPAQPSADNKLLVLDLSGNWVTPTTPPPNGSTVIIINHGWNDGPLDYDGEPGMLSFARTIASRVPNAYIYIWHWGDGPNTKSESNKNGLSGDVDISQLRCDGPKPVFCLIFVGDLWSDIEYALSNSKKHGWLLGNKLLEFGIRPDSPYNHKIHMIGHSFGGVVCANAAYKIYSKTGQKIEQLTTIETPDVEPPDITSGAVESIFPSSAKRVEVIYYYWLTNLLEGAFGGPLNTEADNVLNLRLRDEYYEGSSSILHSIAMNNWYKDSISENTLNCDNAPYGFGWSVSLNPSNPNWMQGLPVGYKYENDITKGCLSDTLGQTVRNTAIKAADKLKDEFESAKTWIGNKGATLILDAKNAVINLITNPLQGQFFTPMAASGKLQMSGLGTLEENPDANVAYIYKDINVPPDAQQLFFDYRFISYNPGDTLSLSIDSNTPLVIDADVEGITENYKTSFPVYVGDYAGRTATIQISLRSTGETSAQVYIDNLRFTAVTITEDINGDKTIDCADLLVLTQNWLNVGCNFRNHCDGADIDQDNDVDFADYARLASMWSESF